MDETPHAPEADPTQNAPETPTPAAQQPSETQDNPVQADSPEPDRPESSDAATELTAPSPRPAGKPARAIARLLRLTHLTQRSAVIAAGALVVLILAGTGGAIYWHNTSTSAPAPQTTTTSQPTPTTTTTDTSTTSGSEQTPPSHTLRPAPSFTISSVTLLAKPVKLGDLHFFANYDHFSGDVSASDIAYYQVGTDQDKRRLIDVQVEVHGPIEDYTDNFITLELSTSNYVILGIPSRLSSDYATEVDQSLASSVTINTTTHVATLEFPANLSVDSSSNAALTANLTVWKNASLVLTPDGLASWLNKTPTAFGTTGNKTAYQVNIMTSTDHRVVRWFVAIQNTYALEYSLPDPLASTVNNGNYSLVAINWTGGQNNSSAYFNEGGFDGCSYYDSYMTLPAGFDTATLTSIGTGPSKQAVYALPNSSTLLNRIYTDRYSKGDGTETTSLKNLTLDQFQANHAVIVAQNNIKEYAIYARSDMFNWGGCGKPVVYLYPERPTYVDVAVDAKVLKSDPLYPEQTGWRQILAQPNGQLTYQGNTYPSLYWEGYAYGHYPAITSGTVVPTFLAPGTIRTQLAEQGLHESEINDFMAFWAHKLPSTPYTRLTWLSTEEMNQLAPLHVSPRPDTLIRVFLDFQGLEQPRTLAQQHFQAPARNGFTVVEWGGLLRGGIR